MKPKNNKTTAAEKRRAMLERISAFMSDASDTELRLLDAATRTLRRSGNPRRAGETIASAMQRAVHEADRALQRGEGKSERPPCVPPNESMRLVGTLASFALWSFTIMESEEHAESERLERTLNQAQRIEHLARALAGVIEKGTRHDGPS